MRGLGKFGEPGEISTKEKHEEETPTKQQERGNITYQKRWIKKETRIENRKNQRAKRVNPHLTYSI